MSKNYSIIRSHEYSKLSKIKLDGSILDVGGSTKSGYHELIGGENNFVAFNINPDYGCDIVGDVEEIFPIDDAAYDHAVCLNLLEHVYNFQNVISETSRVLKSGGKLVMATPFLFQVHGSPDDYFRYTPSALKRLLKDNDFSDIQIEPLGHGIFSLVFQILGGALPRIIRIPVQKIFVFFDKLFLKTKKYRDLRSRIPLGYFVVASKN